MVSQFRPFHIMLATLWRLREGRAYMYQTAVYTHCNGDMQFGTCRHVTINVCVNCSLVCVDIPNCSLHVL